MRIHRLFASVVSLLFLSLFNIGCTSGGGGRYNVHGFGASGNGQHIDSAAINKAIASANKHGGGTVYFPAGNYLSYSIHLQSNVTLYLDTGATIVAADPKDGLQYDDAEPNLAGVPDANHEYQDFGHSHWHNSLIWGENLENVAIVGPGKIWGRGLARAQTNTTQPAARNATDIPQHDSAVAAQPGAGNKAIALKLCRNVILKDFTIAHGGWFAILATGVDNFTLDNLKIDTNRDGVDLDCCQNVRMSNCTVNSPHDDGICPKSSFALGYLRPSKNITITNCQVSGYVEGSLLDGTYRRDQFSSPTGRIKFGTESNGGFQNISISNCVFDYCRGLALESVDGAKLEDIAISNITMRDIANAPIFIRLGSRLRGPHGTEVGDCRRITISNVTVYNADYHESCIISGIPDHDIADLRLSNIRILFQGGGRKKLATSQPAENETKYPEPSMFGDTPAYGFFIRHAKNVSLDHIDISTHRRDGRSPFVLDDVKGITLDHVQANTAKNVPMFRMNNVKNFQNDDSAKPGKKQKKKKKNKPIA